MGNGVDDVGRLRSVLAPAGAGHGPRGQGQKRGAWACVAFLEPCRSDWFGCALACLGRASVKELLWVGLSHHWARRHPPRRQALRLRRWVVPCPRVRFRQSLACELPGVQAPGVSAPRMPSATQPMRPAGRRVRQPGTGRALLPCLSASPRHACRATRRPRVTPLSRVYRRNPWRPRRTRPTRPGRSVARLQRSPLAGPVHGRGCVATPRRACER